MSLLAMQRAFIGELAGDDDTPTSLRSIAIYRGAYRARLAEALTHSFERTLRWVGEEMFERAAAHYILSHPPRSWTLDSYGDCFAATLAQLFADDPEVGELAWMEWHMQQAFAAPDCPVVTPQELTAMNLSEAGWTNLRLLPGSGMAVRLVEHDLAELWQALGDDQVAPACPEQTGPQGLVIWRKDLRPRYRHLPPDEFEALSLMVQGATFGQTAEHLGEAALPRFGQWFAEWLHQGLFSSADPSARPEGLFAA